MSHFQSNYISFLETVEDLYKKNKIAEALVLVFAVIDSVSKEKYSSLYSSERTKKFIEDNFLIITEYGFPGILASSIQIKIEDDVEFNYNFPIILVFSNDIGFEEVFRFQLRGVIEPGDIVMAISGSGNSKNVINAVEYAKECGNKVIGITGYNGGKLIKLSDISLHAPINSMQVTEDIHMIFDHLMMSVLYLHLCGKNHLSQ